MYFSQRITSHAFEALWRLIYRIYNIYAIHGRLSNDCQKKLVSPARTKQTKYEFRVSNICLNCYRLNLQKQATIFVGATA